MFFVHHHALAAAALSLLCCILPTVNANAITTATSPTPTGNNNPATCEFRTINYITASLPRQCLRSAWSGLNSVSTKTDMTEDVIATSQMKDGATATSSGIANHELIANKVGNGTHKNESSPRNDPTLVTPISVPSTTETNLSPSFEADGGELNEAAFLSFEEWKKQTLEKAGQVNENIGNKKPFEPGQKRRDPESVQSSFDSLGDDGEIYLDFGAFRSSDGNEEATHMPQASEPESQQDSQTQDVPRKHREVYRSKDAGKTYKERFSYASFDGGATVLKTHPGAKNAKAVLVENKDSYMLSECAAENKFLIIELSEDIWIDTLVLANYEFFSSMIRTFRVSVSDRYPVKLEKWKDLGTYEARNSREIQAFLIENPQIWARYIRIEFLSHYGNEYYCPLSLVRVHGTRMLESWKETEAIGDEDESEDSDEQGTEEHFVPDAVALVVQEEEKLNAELKQAQPTIHNVTKTPESTPSEPAKATPNLNFHKNFASYSNASLNEMTNPWIKQDNLFHIFDQLYSSSEASIICHIADATTGLPNSPTKSTLGPTESSTPETKSSVTTPPPATASDAPPPSPPPGRNITDPTTLENSDQPQTPPVTIETPDTTASSQETNATATATASFTGRSQNVTSPQKNKTATSTSSSASSLPTIQESFFNAVSRRLQLLEANSTLSLKYIEEQSKILREAFTKVEKKQLQKTETFLDTLNSTVLEELRGFRQQYDEIWQSTVISLESQREESKREILAVSTRLNILADEVIFQKRMSIVQSVLLLLCLGLIIFSRVSAGGALEFPSMQVRTRNSVFHATPGDSPVESPSLRCRDDSPPTPISSYSRSDNALTPPSGGDDSLLGATSNPVFRASEYVDPSTQSTHSATTSPQSTIWRGHSDNDESTYLSPSSAGTPRRRDGIVNQQLYQPTSGVHQDVIGGSQTSLECRSWVGQDGRSEDKSLHLPSPPPERRSEETEQYIACKPLPALPQHDS